MSRSDWADVHSKCSSASPGVYRIRLACDGKPVAIPRFLETDVDGILAIGKSICLEDRRSKFPGAVKRGRGHSEINLLHVLERFSSLSVVHPGAGYEYAFIPLRTKEEAEAEESRLLKTYLLRFGEVPPLNSAIPGGRYASDSWAPFASVKVRRVEPKASA